MFRLCSCSCSFGTVFTVSMKILFSLLDVFLFQLLYTALCLIFISFLVVCFLDMLGFSVSTFSVSAFGLRQFLSHQNSGRSGRLDVRGLLSFLLMIALATSSKLTPHLLMLLTDIYLLFCSPHTHIYYNQSDFSNQRNEFKLYFYSLRQIQLNYLVTLNIYYSTFSLGGFWHHKQSIIVVEMIKSLNVPQSEFSISQRLLTICKKSSSLESKPEIDFLLLDREMEQLQNMQSRTVQQIVQFVDEHLEQFTLISNNFSEIESSVQSTEGLIKKLIPRLDYYKSKLFSPQSKIQQFITQHEKQLMQKQLIEGAKEEAEFLLNFVHEFESLGNMNIEQLSHRHKFCIVRLLRKKDSIKNLFQHSMLHSVSGSTVDLSILLANIIEELQFYLSEQLSRVALSNAATSHHHNLTITREIQTWYKYMGKQTTYFERLEESIIGRTLSNLELLLLSHKQNLAVGNDEHIVKQAFTQLFDLVKRFPDDFPNQRVLKLVYRFIGKKQLNFLYSYVAPTFPIAYSAYQSAVSKLQNPALKAEFETKHLWNLKMWADLRIKTIMDRSGKDKTKSLAKWLEIVFKKSFMIPGVKSFMVKLAFQLVNRNCTKLLEEVQFSGASLNENYVLIQAIPSILKERLSQGFAEELRAQTTLQRQLIEQTIKKTIQNMLSLMQSAFKKWLMINMQMVINTCKNSLEPYKSLVLSIISKKQRNKTFNSHQNILKPLRAYLKNNAEISEDCSKYLESVVLDQVGKYYCIQYVKQIYNHCQSSVLPEQMKVVMNVVANQKQNLFPFSGQDNTALQIEKHQN